MHKYIKDAEEWLNNNKPALMEGFCNAEKDHNLRRREIQLAAIVAIAFYMEEHENG